MTVFRVLQGANGVCLAAFLTLLIVVPSGYAWTGLAAGGLAVLSAGAWWLQRHWPLPGEAPRWRRDGQDALWLAAPTGYALVWLADVLRSGEWPVGAFGWGVALPLWPLLAALVVLAWRSAPPSFTAWRLGLGAGALATAGLALFERQVLGLPRAGHWINPIPFGDLSLLFGALCVIALLESVENGARRRVWRWWLAAAALAGLLGSLLSGTRGGWVALPLLAWLWYGNFYRVLPRGALIGVSVVLAVSLTVAVAVPHTGVAKRADLAVEQVLGYFQDGEKATSVGIRLEMWRAGAQLIAERPLFGWGEGGLQARRDQLVAAGSIHPGVQRYDQLHSDLIDTTARRGVPGLVSLLLLYGVPLVLFARRLAPDRSSEVRALALSGVAVVAAFVDFGLTQTLLRDVHGLAGFLGLTAACWLLMRRAEHR